MDSTVRSRPNHYEVLRLTPAATGDEIAQAFAEELNPLRPRPFGSLAEVTVAYETLRDRTRREAYDIALGLKPPVTPPEWASYSMRASARPAVRPATDPSPRPAPQADTRARPEPKLPPFVLASGPGPSEPQARETRPESGTIPEELRRPEDRPKPAIDPQLSAGRLHFAESGRFRIDGDAPFQWKLQALAAGALILAVGLGAWTGLEAGNDNEQEQSEQAATLKIPPAKPLPAMSALPDASMPSVAQAQPERRTRSAPATDQRSRDRQPLQITLPEEQPLEAAQREDVAIEQAAAETAPIEAAASKMPLPNAVIARTIGRIGYPCGQVATTTAVGGDAPGVFKVTCTSGHSYRAAPVRGRYRFRRLG